MACDGCGRDIEAGAHPADNANMAHRIANCGTIRRVTLFRYYYRHSPKQHRTFQQDLCEVCREPDFLAGLRAVALLRHRAWGILVIEGDDEGMGQAALGTANEMAG